MACVSEHFFTTLSIHLHSLSKLNHSSSFILQLSKLSQMAGKQIDLNVEAEEKSFDLTFNLGNDSSESNEKGKVHQEEEGKAHQEEAEGIDARQTLEDRIAVLEHRLQQVEKAINDRSYELAARVDQNFTSSIQPVYEQLAHNSKNLGEIHSILNSIITSLRPKLPELQKAAPKPGTSSFESKKPPRP